MKQTFFRLMGVMALAQAAWAAQILGIVNNQLQISSASPDISFAAVAPAQTTLLNFGTQLGINVSYDNLSANGTNFNPNSYHARSEMFVTVGSGSSVSGLLSEAWSGATRLTNTGASPAAYAYTQTLTFSLQTLGPGSGNLLMFAFIERFDTGIGTWEILNEDAAGVGTNVTNANCAAGCVTVIQNTLAPQSFVDLRVRTRLTGGLSQSGLQGGGRTDQVPEPTSIALIGTGMAQALWLRGRRR